MLIKDIWPDDVFGSFALKTLAKGSISVSAGAGFGGMWIGLTLSKI